MRGAYLKVHPTARRPHSRATAKGAVTRRWKMRDESRRSGRAGPPSWKPPKSSCAVIITHGCSQQGPRSQSTTGRCRALCTLASRWTGRRKQKSCLLGGLNFKVSSFRGAFPVRFPFLLHWRFPNTLATEAYTGTVISAASS